MLYSVLTLNPTIHHYLNDVYTYKVIDVKTEHVPTEIVSVYVHN